MTKYFALSQEGKCIPLGAWVDFDECLHENPEANQAVWVFSMDDLSTFTKTSLELLERWNDC
jgi:hypothetical protein